MLLHLKTKIDFEQLDLWGASDNQLVIRAEKDVSLVKSTEQTLGDVYRFLKTPKKYAKNWWLMVKGKKKGKFKQILKFAERILVKMSGREKESLRIFIVVMPK